jgi:hypothetical protein
MRYHKALSKHRGTLFVDIPSPVLTEQAIRSLIRCTLALRVCLYRRVDMIECIREWETEYGPKSIWKIDGRYFYISSVNNQESRIPVQETMAFLCTECGLVLDWLESWAGCFNTPHREVATQLQGNRNEQHAES